MARARNIKPSFFINEELVECDFSTRLLFIGLWTLADREGKLEDKPKKIKMALFPSDNINVDELLNELKKHGFIERYEFEGNQYIQVVAFKKHQNPHRDEKPSIIPDFIKHCVSTVQASCKEQLSTVAIGLIPDSLNLIPETLLLKPETIKPNPPRKNALDDGFHEFWNFYPNKTGKEAARKAWIKEKPKIDSVLQALRWQINCEQWLKQGGQFIPNPATYINQGRWLDEPKMEVVF